MFLQQAGIPDNVSYLVLGMVILFAMLGGWIASLRVRMRNLRLMQTQLDSQQDQ